MSTIAARLTELRAGAGFLAGLPRFLATRMTHDETVRTLERRLEERDRSFALLLRRAVFDRPRSPYRRLLEWAGIAPEDVERMAAETGVEETLRRLHQAGVHVSLEEFKGLRPLCRPNLELPVRAEEWDNLPPGAGYGSRTGGSGGTPRRILVGLDLLAHEALYHARFYAGDATPERPAVLWLPAPPGAVGIKSALIRARLGQPVVRWFSQTDPRLAPARHRAFGAAVRLAARAAGSRIPAPEHAPAAAAAVVARYVAQCRAAGPPPILLTTPSGAVRVAAAARELGMDIGGTMFVVVGEPWTRPKAELMVAAGAVGASHYAMVEAGMIGLACRRPREPDDVHLVSDKIATITRPTAVDGNGRTVPALYHTTLSPAVPKLMINVESGDHGVMEERDCGCGVLPAGYRRHLHSIRSHEKLTSEGMHFLGADLLTLLEQELPGRFGGRPTDFQLVERDVAGVPRVQLRVSPRVGPLDPGAVSRATLDFLRDRGIGQRLMTEVWRDGGTLEVVRAEPHVTAAGKVLPIQRVER